MSDLTMRRRLQAATELAKDIDKAADRLRALPRRVKASRPLGFDDGIAEDEVSSQKKALARGDSNAHGVTQLNTGWPPLPLRTIPMCEFCYLNMRPTDTAEYCLEHDMGGHVGCHRLHKTTVHQ